MVWMMATPRREDTALEYRCLGETGMRVWGIGDCEGRAFDRGRVFSGGSLEIGLEASGEPRELVPEAHHLS